MGIPPTVVLDAASGTHVGKSHLTPRHADSTFAGGSFFNAGTKARIFKDCLESPVHSFRAIHFAKQNLHNEKAPEKTLRGFGTFFFLECLITPEKRQNLRDS